MSTTPALGELLLQLGRAPTREPAARALFGWLDHTLSRSGVRGDRAERVRSRVACKLLELSRSARLTQIENAEAYARRMVQHALIDLRKEDQRHVGEASFDGECEWNGERSLPLQGLAEPASAEEKGALEESVHACRERARGLLRRAFAEVLAGAAERYHAGLRASFEDLCALALDQASLRARLLRGGPGTVPVNADANVCVKGAAFTAAYKRHERMRRSLRDAIEALACAGRLTRREAEQAEGCLALLLRAGPKSRAAGGQRSRTTPQPAVLRLQKKQEEQQRVPGGEPRSALRGAA